MIANNQILVLTPKGRDELKTRAFKLDTVDRNTLFLVEKGNSTPATILQRSLFPKDIIAARIQALVSGGFLDAGAAAGAPSSASALPAQQTLQLKPGISLSQARFSLSDFCLEHFGTRSARLVESIERCGDVPSLQKVIDMIHAEIRQNAGNRLPALANCVAEINDSA